MLWKHTKQKITTYNQLVNDYQNKCTHSNKKFI